MSEDKTRGFESAGGIVLGKDGRLAIVCQHGNSWSFPKGHIHESELLIDAARREIFEETGLSSLHYIRDLGSYERYSIGKDGTGESTEWGMRRRTFFLFRTEETELDPSGSEGEVTEAKWATFDEALHLLTHAKDREFLESIRAILSA